jgi:SAM-dependent methyltransferase
MSTFKLQQAWDRIHRETPIPTQPAQELAAFAEHVRPRLPLGAPVLDAGCGRGRNLPYLAQMGFCVCGCDLSPVAIKIAKAQISQAAASLHVAHLANLPYPDGLFAMVVCVHVMPYHHKTDIARIVNELRRVLQANGWLYADFLDRDDAIGSATRGCGQELEAHTFLDPDGVPTHFSSRSEINELLCGFALERVTRFEVNSGPRPRVGWVVWATKAVSQ